VQHGKSWMLPEAKSQDLLYVVRGGEGTVSVFTFPKGKPVGALSNIPGAFGICSDTTGDVFVVARENDEIYEFAHGGTKPIATLDDFGNDANGCAVDPASGNLAVAGGLKAGPLKDDANVAVYQHARGSPTLYKSSAPQFTFCTYDSQGNVFMGARCHSNCPGEAIRLSKYPYSASANLRLPAFNGMVLISPFRELQAQREARRRSIKSRFRVRREQLFSKYL
jgi:hypothetical protein